MERDGVAIDGIGTRRLPYVRKRVFRWSDDLKIISVSSLELLVMAEGYLCLRGFSDPNMVSSANDRSQV